MMSNNRGTTRLTQHGAQGSSEQTNNVVAKRKYVRKNPFTNAKSKKTKLTEDDEIRSNIEDPIQENSPDVLENSDQANDEVNPTTTPSVIQLKETFQSQVSENVKLKEKIELQLQENLLLQEKLLNLRYGNDIETQKNETSSRFYHNANQHLTKSDIFDKIKQMPKFSGNGGENFGTWQISAKDFLDRFEFESEATKVKALLCRIEGYARQAIEAMRPEIRTIKDVFESLKVTYGQDERNLLYNCNQKQDETVKIYYSRLLTNLKICAVNSRIQQLQYFLQGLLPAVGVKVRSLLPTTLHMALDYAVQQEFEITTQQDQKKTRKPNENINHIQDSNSFQESAVLNRFDSKILDKLNAISGQFGVKMNELEKNLSNLKKETNDNHAILTNSVKQLHHSQLESEKKPFNSSRNPVKYSGTCFICKKIGHKYFQCQTASANEKETVRNNFTHYLNAYRQ